MLIIRREGLRAFPGWKAKILEKGCGFHGPQEKRGSLRKATRLAAFCVFPLLLNFLHKENIVYEVNDYCEKHDRYPRDYRPY